MLFALWSLNKTVILLNKLKSRGGDDFKVKLELYQKVYLFKLVSLT